jgi:hypothetical protein
MLLYIIASTPTRDAMAVATVRLKPAFWVTAFCALLMLCAQAFAHAHLHVGADEITWLDCGECMLAKHQLTSAVDAPAHRPPPDVRPPVPYITPAAARSAVPASRFRARAPPAA